MPIMVIKMESPAKNKLFDAPSITSRAIKETAIDTLISGINVEGIHVPGGVNCISQGVRK